MCISYDDVCTNFKDTFPLKIALIVIICVRSGVGRASLTVVLLVKRGKGVSVVGRGSLEWNRSRLPIELIEVFADTGVL
jgi:hypothetical protein